MGNEKLLAWMDLETTGLEPRYCPIIEVALVITDFDLHIEDSYTSAVLPKGFQTPDELIKYMNEHCDEYVLNMHTESNLLKTIESGNMAYQEDVVRDLDGLLTRCAEGDANAYHLTGSGVASFDMLFLREQYPTLVDDHFSYQCVDIGQVRRFLEKVCGIDAATPDYEGTPHRAMDDVQNFITQAHAFRHVMTDGKAW